MKGYPVLALTEALPADGTVVAHEVDSEVLLDGGVSPGGLLPAARTDLRRQHTDGGRALDLRISGENEVATAKFNDEISADPAWNRCSSPLRDGLTIIRLVS